MKKFLLMFFMAACVVHAAEMGRFDKISGSWIVKNNFFSCSFLQGNMFPGEFTFPDGTAPGVIIFKDTVTAKDGKSYTLFEERWAETKILKNDENGFIIERSGRFWRNLSPVISPLEGISAVCRYEFKKDSPEISIQITCRKKPDVSCKINNAININWYAFNPFDRIVVNGKEEKLVTLSGKRFRHWDLRKKVVLKGKNAVLTMKAPRCIATLIPADRYPVRLNGGSWQHVWKKGDTRVQKAVLRLEKAK